MAKGGFNRAAHSEWEDASDPIVLAFGTLEVARLLCERLREAYPGDQALQLIHRDIGLAGYHASDEFSPGLRRRCLILAREEASDTRDWDYVLVLETLFDATDNGVAALACALATSGAEHLQLAHFHASCAAEALDCEVMRQAI